MTYGGIIQSVKVPDRRRALRERHPGLRQPHGLRRAKPVLRVHHGPVREPDRTRQVHARRRHLPAADQQPAELASRRNRRLRQAHLGHHGDPEPRRRRSQDDVHEPARRPGLSGHAQVRGRLLADRQERDPDGLPGDDGQGDDRQPDEPRLLEPGRRGNRLDRRSRPEAERVALHPGGSDVDPDRRNRSGGRHADGLHPVDRDRRQDPRQLRAARDRPRLRPQLGTRPAQPQRHVDDPRGACAGARQRPSARDLHDRARNPVLLRELPRRDSRRNEWTDVQAGRRVRAGDPALPRLAEQAELPLDRPPSGAGLQDHHDLPVLDLHHH